MGIILVYDSTDQQTFNNISNWLKQIDQHANQNVAKVLVGNKCDRPDRVVEREKGQQLAEQHGLTFFETSAKTGLNVNQVFEHIAKVIVTEKLGAQSAAGASDSNTMSAGFAAGSTSAGSEPIRMQSRQGG